MTEIPASDSVENQAIEAVLESCPSPDELMERLKSVSPLHLLLLQRICDRIKAIHEGREDGKSHVWPDEDGTTIAIGVQDILYPKDQGVDEGKKVEKVIGLLTHSLAKVRFVLEKRGSSPRDEWYYVTGQLRQD